MTSDNDKLGNSIKQTLDNSVDDLDAATLSRIRQVRTRALEKAEGQSINWFSVTSGALATACVMVFAVIILLRSESLPQNVPVDDLDLISSSESFEFYEDLEFYQWLETNELAG